MKGLVRLFCALLLGLLLAPSAALAQGTDWREQRTDRFAILYAPGSEAVAQQYAGFVDGIYDEISARFGHATSTPVTLRLYPTLEGYLRANPLARNVQSVVAHADYRRHEVVVVLEQTRTQTADEIENNIRHELTHIVAADLTNDRLNVNFQEGLAQYVELPSRELEAKIKLLGDALQNNDLRRWSELDDRETFYSHVDISYPESLSIVAFLVERYSFDRMRDFLTASASSSGYRSALERAFGEPADALEKAWRDWLPGYLAGGYRAASPVGYDLSKAEQLVAEGNYDAAEQELGAAIDWLHQNNQPERLQQAEALRDRVADGRAADKLAEDARQAIISADFGRAAELTAQAQHAYRQIDDHRQDTALADYADRALRGQQAEKELQRARALATQLRYPQARTLADDAAAEFSALGADIRANEARALRTFMDQRQTFAGALLLLIGIGGALLSTIRRMFVREAEAW